MLHRAKCHTGGNAVRTGGANQIQRQMLAICAWKSLQNETQSTAADSARREQGGISGTIMSNDADALAQSLTFAGGKPFIGQAKVFTHGANAVSRASQGGAGGDHSSYALLSTSIAVAG